MTNTLHTGADGMPTTSSGVLPLAETLVHDARALATESAHQVRERALRLRDVTEHYVHERPMSSMLVAAAAGGLLVIALGILMRGSRH